MTCYNVSTQNSMCTSLVITIACQYQSGTLHILQNVHSTTYVLYVPIMIWTCKIEGVLKSVVSRNWTCKLSFSVGSHNCSSTKERCGDFQTTQTQFCQDFTRFHTIVSYVEIFKPRQASLADYFG